jgi:carbon storage regulator
VLVLSRKVGERIWIGNEICVTVVRLTSGGVRLGIEAPSELPVIREELKVRQTGEIRETGLASGLNRGDSAATGMAFTELGASQVPVAVQSPVAVQARTQDGSAATQSVSAPELDLNTSSSAKEHSLPQADDGQVR